MSLSIGRRLLPVLGVLTIALPLWAAPAPSEPAYVKAESWAQTVVAARASILRQQAQAAEPSAFKPFTSGPLRGEDAARRISLDITGLQMLRLVTVLEQGRGNCHIWGEAMLIGKDGTPTRLSTLKPTFVKVGWGQVHIDQNWQKNPLQVGDRQFAHGLWVHADSELCFELDGKYNRFEAWIGLDKARATGAATFKVLGGLPDLAPGLAQKIAADFPVQTRWLTQDGARPIDLLIVSNSTKPMESLIKRAIDQMKQAGEPLRQQLAELQRANIRPDDGRWLELYARACRYRQSQSPLQQVALPRLRQALGRQMEELLKSGISADDKRWLDLEAKINRCGEALAATQRLDFASLRPSIQSLAEAFPRRFGGHEALLQQLAAREGEWSKTHAALEEGDEATLKEAKTFMEQLQAFRRSILRGMEGMGGFLAAWAGVDLEKEWASQFAALEHDLRNRSTFARLADQAHHPASLIHESDRDPADVVLRRTAVLLETLSRQPEARPSQDRAAFQTRLAELQQANRLLPPAHLEARYVLFAEACRLRRQIAFSNPLLSFEQLLFLKHHRATFNHMCDQYYGINAKPGGGLFVLADPFSPGARLRNILADSTVTRGRLKGRKLASGSFVSPDLSYDGKTVAFAYVECDGDKSHQFHTDPQRGHWSTGWSYHLFKANIDGTGLEQLTDGTWNDFDPCFLPNGRLAFISERRGGYLRCGRVCPTYTLYEMAADGSDITCLSFHETNEWHPSVTNDGRIIYTRWDYVDRHGCTAHLPWITTLDGRDSRAVHGNFAPRPGRPDMELDVRAIPRSHKFTATAAPHHGQAFGSLVLVDPQVEDDDGMAPVKRITPDVGFPESQGGREAYATAFPLSEDFYLCAYDADMALGKPKAPGNYGLYLLDAFGNKELIYRDAEIACQNPIPLRATPLPPATPVMAAQGAVGFPFAPDSPTTRPSQATVIVVNAYESLKPWPEGTKITALRVLQVLPMTVPSGAPPHDTGLRIKLAEDSVTAARSVLGTVPVEADGSAHFTVPANKEIFFQVLDERGLAVQSMRSATYLQRGERLVCQGCHEPRHRAPRSATSTPLALRRPPSQLKGDVDGSNPFSYPRLVQGVLDRHCVSCHAQQPEKAPNLGRHPIQRKFYASYNSLAPKFGFWSYGQGYRTFPGQFGARASKLLALLDKGHYDVKLPPEDFHRLTLWLDCSSLFYGVYEKEGGEAQLRGEIAYPTLE